jgi:hypothetical protein
MVEVSPLKRWETLYSSVFMQPVLQQVKRDGPVIPDTLVCRVVPAVPVDQQMDSLVQARVDPVDPAGPVDFWFQPPTREKKMRKTMGKTKLLRGRVDQAGPVDQVDPTIPELLVDLVDLAGPVDLASLVVRVDPVGLVVRVTEEPEAREHPVYLENQAERPVIRVCPTWLLQIIVPWPR